jgi:L-arabonate dehydrase
MSLGEPLMRPSSMLFRNLVSMDVEESIRANPLDGVVLLMGCDKTTPALLMGAASCDLPTIGLSGGPMLSGKFRGRELGSGTGVWQMSEDLRAGRITEEEFRLAEGCMNRSKGHCMTMGTASTMACLVEALGMALPGNATIPAVDAHRFTLAQLTGRRIVAMINEGLQMSRIATRAAFENAVRTNAAIGGSTNAVVHLLALAKRLYVDLELQDWDRLGSQMPCLVDLQPAGKHLMEDFYYAGGLPVVLRSLLEAGHLDGGALTVNGRNLKENVESAENWNTAVVRPFASPLKDKAGIAVLFGNLAPSGAIIKPAAASSHLLRHRGRAVVFESIEDFHARIDDEGLDIDENCIMVLKNCGPRGYPGMPEVGNMQLPPKILRKGIKDMVRISDARMSGTAYGTVVLHVTPEAATGGPLALVQDGDDITLNVANRTLNLEVDPATLEKRRLQWKPPPNPVRGYSRLYVEHVLQADQGADFDFLVGGSGSEVTRDAH